MWQNGVTVASDWAGAQTYCAGLSWGGYSGWSLPDIDQLRSLIRGCADTETGGSCGVTDGCLDLNCDNAACNNCSGSGPGPGGAFWPPEISGVISWYWSSSAVADLTGDAWMVSFFSGFVVYLSDGAPQFGARCVRP
jgi:hypothetical protein